MSFDEKSLASIELAKEAALQILLHNAQALLKDFPYRWLGVPGP